MQFFFIRHAQSVNNAVYFQGEVSKRISEDPELTDIGLHQARVVAQFLKNADPKEIKHCEKQYDGFGITHLYCSLMLRSVQTGTIIARELGLPLFAWQEIHECGGIYLKDEATGEVTCLPGKDRAYFSTHFPELELPGDMVESGWWDSRPVETSEDSLRRARSFIESLRERHAGADERVAIVSHGGFYNDLLSAILRIPRIDGAWFSLYNTAISRIDFQENLTELVYQNRVDHLPCEWIT